MQQSHSKSPGTAEHQQHTNQCNLSNTTKLIKDSISSSSSCNTQWIQFSNVDGVILNNSVFLFWIKGKIYDQYSYDVCLLIMEGGSSPFMDWGQRLMDMDFILSAPPFFQMSFCYQPMTVWLVSSQENLVLNAEIVLSILVIV